MNKQEIPNIIISRLPIYLRALRLMQEEGKLTTSSQELGAGVGISASTGVVCSFVLTPLAMSISLYWCG